MNTVESERNISMVEATLAELFRDANDSLGVKAVANCSNVDPATIYTLQEREAPQRTFRNLCSVIAAQARLGNPGVLKALAECAGWVALPLPANDETQSPERLRASALAITQFAELVNQLADAKCRPLAPDQQDEFRWAMERAQRHLLKIRRITETPKP